MAIGHFLVGFYFLFLHLQFSLLHFCDEFQVKLSTSNSLEIHARFNDDLKKWFLGNLLSATVLNGAKFCIDAR